MKRLISALNLFINEDQVIDGISKRDFKTILLLFKKKPYLIFNETIYKQKDELAMGSPLDTTFVDLTPFWLCFYEKSGYKTDLC